MSDDFEPACRRMEWLDPFYKQVWEKAFAEGIPISGTFELTPRCNFSCKMCYVHLKPEEIPQNGVELTAKEWLRIAEEAKAAGTTWVCVTGGEPLLHPEFPEIWQSLTEMGFFLTLQTNASLVRGKMLDLLERCPPRQAKVTLYGSDDEVYQAVCGVEQGFTRVNEGIHNLMSLGIPVELVSTIIRQNQNDVERMAFYAYRHKLPWVATGSVKPSLRGAATCAQVVAVTEKLNAQKRSEVERRLKEEKLLDLSRKPASYCKDYRIGFWVLWDGKMRFCSFMDEPDIPVRDMHFQEAWKQLLDFEESLDWPAECRTCAASRVCQKCAATANFVKKQVRFRDCEIIREAYSQFAGNHIFE